MKTLRLIALCALVAFIAVPSFAANSCCAMGGTCQMTDAKDCPLAVAAPDNTLTAQEKATGWKLLFDGKTFNGWGFTDPTPGGWIVDKGAMFYTVKGGAYAYTQQTFGNFELKADFMVEKGTNSGIFFRWSNLADPVQTGFEMQVLDTADKTKMDKHDCGALYDVLAPTQNAMKPAMEWNTADIVCMNNIISISLNGKRVVVANLDRWTEPNKNPDGTPNKFGTAYKDMARSGHIGLQAHGGKLWFKNLKVREL